MHSIRELVLPFLELRFWSEDTWKEVRALFKFYMDDIKVKTVRTSDGRELPYLCRFEESRLKAKLAKFTSILRCYNSLHDTGVFLTITAKPEDTIWEARRNLMKTVHNISRFLWHEYGRKVPHVCLVEPHRNGKPHVHCIFYGVHRIEDFKQLGLRLQGYGAGKIFWIKKLSKEDIERLSKHFITSLEEHMKGGSLAWYWATGSRFYVYSRIHCHNRG